MLVGAQSPHRVSSIAKGTSGRVWSGLVWYGDEMEKNDEWAKRTLLTFCRAVGWVSGVAMIDGRLFGMMESLGGACVGVCVGDNPSSPSRFDAGAIGSVYLCEYRPSSRHVAAFKTGRSGR